MSPAVPASGREILPPGHLKQALPRVHAGEKGKVAMPASFAAGYRLREWGFVEEGMVRALP
jgi:hypothetical protein